MIEITISGDNRDDLCRQFNNLMGVPTEINDFPSQESQPTSDLPQVESAATADPDLLRDEIRQLVTSVVKPRLRECLRQVGASSITTCDDDKLDELLELLSDGSA